MENDTKKEMDLKDIQELRYLVEFRLIPGYLHYSRDAFPKDLVEHKEVLITALYYKQAEPEASPYTPEDFSVEDLEQIGNWNCVKIEMPDKHIRMPLCRRVYILWNSETDGIGYYTVEQSLKGNIMGSVDKEGTHFNYGEVRQEEEIFRITALIYKE